MRVVVAEDSVLLRAGLVRLLEDDGFEIAAEVGDAVSLKKRVRADPPDLCIVDVRMPPTNRADGLQAAIELRGEFPDLAVLILSQYVEPHYALELLSQGAEGVGYLLKERISTPADFIDALHRVSQRGTVIDPSVVSQLVGRQRRDDSLARLTDREREVLEAMAEGRANSAIADTLYMSEKTVEAHVRSIFQKLDLAADHDTNRRVLAVLRWLRQ